MANNVPERSYYETLCVRRNCNDREIQLAFRKLAIKYHPDKNASTEEKFKEIVKAYKILSDPEKRRLYDAGGNANLQDNFGDYFKDFDLSEFINFFRHETYSYSFKKRAVTTYNDVNVTLVDIYNGATKNVRVPKHILCSSCRGTGTSNVSQDCQLCGLQQNVWDDTFECDLCHGSGTQPCVCGGNGIVTIHKEYEVEIKKGMCSGQEIVLIGEGDEEPESRPGDRIFTVCIAKHEQFKIESGSNLKTIIWLTSTEARKELVTKQIKTLDGRLVLVKIEKGKSLLKIPNEGLPDYFKPERKGALVVQVKIQRSQSASTIKSQKKRANELSAEEVWQSQQLMHEENGTFVCYNPHVCHIPLILGCHIFE